MSEELDFKIIKGLVSGNPEIDEYIERLHAYLLGFETSNIKKLILSLDRMAGVIAEDVEKIIDGEDQTCDEVCVGHDEDSGEPLYEKIYSSTLKVLNDQKDSKIYDRVMNLFTKIESLNAVSKTAKSLIPEVVEIKQIDAEEEFKKDVKLSGKGNSFEEMQSKHHKQRAGKTIV